MKTGVPAALAGALLGLAACQPAAVPGADAAAASGAPTDVLKDFEMNDVKSGVKSMTLISVEGRIYEPKHYADVDKPFLYFYKEG